MAEANKKKMSNVRKIIILSAVKSWALMFLMVLLAAALTTDYFFLRESVLWEARAIQEEEFSQKQLETWMPDSKDMFDTNNMTWELYMAAVKANEGEINELGLWVTYTFSAYTSLDDGVDNIAADGTDIGKGSVTRNYGAVPQDSWINRGDEIIIRWWEDLLPRVVLIVDYFPTGVVGDPEEPEIDLYFGVDVLRALKFGIQRMDVIVLKGGTIAVEN